MFLAAPPPPLPSSSWTRISSPQSFPLTLDALGKSILQVDYGQFLSEDQMKGLTHGH